MHHLASKNREDTAGYSQQGIGRSMKLKGYRRMRTTLGVTDSHETVNGSEIAVNDVTESGDNASFTTGQTIYTWETLWK
jgi:hypothetical protein